MEIITGLFQTMGLSVIDNVGMVKYESLPVEAFEPTGSIGFVHTNNPIAIVCGIDQIF